MTAMSFTHLARIGAASLAALTAACASAIPERLPHQRHQIAVREVREHVEIRVRPGQSTLSFQALDALRAVAADHRRTGHGPIAIALPIGAANAQDAVRLAAEARGVLQAEGLAFRHITGAAYDAEGRADAPLVVMYTRYVAEGPRCGERWEDFNVTTSGDNTLNFGCAHQANLAAMVSNPRDLIDPRDLDPSDSQRRLEALEQYRTGQTTTTQRNDNETAGVSDAVD